MSQTQSQSQSQFTFAQSEYERRIRAAWTPLTEWERFLPLNADGAPVGISSTSPEACMTLSEAEARRPSDGYVGFQLAETPFCCIDSDKVTSDGSLEGLPEPVASVIERLPTEHSKSLTGFHSFTRGSFDKSLKQSPDLEAGGQMEFFDGEEGVRYIALTGDTVAGRECESLGAAADYVRSLHQAVSEPRATSESTRSQEHSRPAIDSERRVEKTIEWWSDSESALSRKAQRTLSLMNETPARQKGDSSSEDDVEFLSYAYWWAKGDVSLTRGMWEQSKRWDDKCKNHPTYVDSTMEYMLNNYSGDVYEGDYCALEEDK